MKLTKTSILTGNTNTVDLPITEEQLEAGQLARAKGAYIQDAFPMLDVHQREFIQTGTSKEDWDDMCKRFSIE